MSIEKNRFNNNLFQSNDYLINSHIAPNARRKNQKYLNKDFYQISMPNHTVNINQNIILPSEQSTLLTTEDCQYKKLNIVEEKRKRNNCVCLCHQIEEELLNHNCNIVCYHTPIVSNHPTCLKKHRQIYRSVDNSLSRNNKPNQHKNFELVYNYQKLKKEYNIKNCTNYNERNERINNFNYTTDIKDKYCFSRNMWKPTHKCLNRSWDDCKVNYNYNACNYLLRKTRTILGYPSFSMDYKYGHCHHRPTPISYISDDYYNNLSPLSQTMNNIYESRERRNYNPKSKSIDFNPLYNNYTFKGKNDNNNNLDENNNNQIIQNEGINNCNNINNSKNFNEGRGNLNNTFNNNSMKDNFDSKINSKFNNSLNKSEIINNKYNNNKKEKSPKMNNIKCNNNILAYNNNNISFGNEEENEDNTNQINQNNNIRDNRKIYGNNFESNIYNDNRNIKNFEQNNNNNIINNKNKNLKDIIIEKNLFMKVKNKDKIHKTKENNLNDNIDPNKKLIKDILNIKSNKDKNNAKKKKQNTRYLDYQNSNVDSIIEKILEKNHGKNKEDKYKRNYNNKKIDILKKGKLNYTNTYKNKIGKKFGLPTYTKFTEFYNFKEKQKQKFPSNITKKDNQIKNKKITSKTPIKTNKENILNKVNNQKDKININKILAKEKQGRNKNKNRSQSTLNNDKNIKNKTTNNNNTKNKNYPYLDIMHLNKINKLIHNSRFQNSILYNNIIQPYNNSKTLQNNNIHYKKHNINLQNQNMNETDNLNVINENTNLIKEKDELFNLTAPNKDKTLKTSKSCFIDNNRYNLGNENQLTRNLSANLGSCFACYFGCSVSRSGYSPMNYSPYDGRKRHDNLGIPSHILYKFGNKCIS